MIKFSKSKLNTFLACSEKYRLHYELGIRSPKTSNSLVEGSCIHHLIETGIVYRDHIEDVLDIVRGEFWTKTALAFRWESPRKTPPGGASHAQELFQGVQGKSGI